METSSIPVLATPAVQVPPFCWITYTGHAIERGNQAMARLSVLVFAAYLYAPDADRATLALVDAVLPIVREVPHCLVVGAEGAGAVEVEGNVQYLTAQIDIEEKR